MNAYRHFVLLHGSYGSPASNWLPWLADSLQLEGHAISFPILPTPEGQSLKSWQITLITGGGHLNSESGLAEFPKLLENVRIIASSE
jgi:predicted alpha/beta hydrolase family esterase